jgi:hypothetical protein
MANSELPPGAQEMFDTWRRDMDDVKGGLAKMGDLMSRLIGLEESRKYTEKSLENLWGRHSQLEANVALIDKTLTTAVASVTERAGQGSRLWGWLMPAAFGFVGSLVGGLLLYLVAR